MSVAEGGLALACPGVVASTVTMTPRAFMPQASVELNDSLELVVLNVLVDR